jgi:hypothetical protein
MGELHEDGDCRRAGKVIQDALYKEMIKCTPYARIEVSTTARFDGVMYIPPGGQFFADEPEKVHCPSKYRKKYCREKWRAKCRQLEIPNEERQKMFDELRKKDSFQPAPNYRVGGREFIEEGDLFRSIKDCALCVAGGCVQLAHFQAEADERRATHGFLGGLHVFEVKSNSDNFLLLEHQIPNMVAIADYVWLVLGDEQSIPEWLPPYVSVMGFDGKKFKIERVAKISISQPPIYWHSFKDSGVDVGNPAINSLARLYRKAQINSMFRFSCEGNICIDMSDELRSLFKLLAEGKGAMDTDKFQKSLFAFVAAEAHP